MPKKFDAILFDLDGTLLDSRELIFQSFFNTLLKYDISLSREEIFLRIQGLRLSECYQLLASQYDAEELSRSHREIENQFLHLSKPFGNVKETLTALSQSILKKAVITNRGGPSVIKTLELADILHHFQAIITIDDVANGKPHPEPIWKALSMLNVSAARTVMVGDTDVDIIVGKEAGVITIGVTYGLHGKDIEKNNPDFLVHDIREILLIILD